MPYADINAEHQFHTDNRDDYRDASDEEVLEVSMRLIKQNKEAYLELAGQLPATYANHLAEEEVSSAKR